MHSTTTMLRLATVAGGSIALLLTGVTTAQALPTAAAADGQTLNVTTHDIYEATDESPGRDWYRLIYNQAGVRSVARVVVDDGEPVHHDGALHLSTPDADGRLDIRYAVDSSLYEDKRPASELPTLADLAEATFAVKVMSGTAPAFTVAYNCDGRRHHIPFGSHTITFAGAIPADQSWHTVDLGAEDAVWMVDGQRQTGAQLMAACPLSILANYGFLQSGAGADALVDDVSVGGLTTNFLVPPLQRVFGGDRRGTACAAAAQQYGDGDPLATPAYRFGIDPTRVQTKAKAVVLANQASYPDALAAGPLAAAAGGPLLLTRGSALDTTCGVRSLPQGSTVYLVGGSGVLSPAVESSVRSLGLDVVRLGGTNRYDTAVKVAQAIDSLRPAGTPQQVFLASGTDFPDALSAGAPAGAASGAVLLTQGPRMAPATAAYLAGRPDATVYAVGGPAAAAASLPADHELVGANRYETATIMADRFFPEPASAAFASGANFPDAISASAYGGNVGAPVLLVAPTAVPDVVAGYAQRHRATLRGSMLLGGSDVVTDAILTRLSRALTPSSP